MIKDSDRKHIEELNFLTNQKFLINSTKDKLVVIENVAKYILGKYHILTVVTDKQEYMYAYEDGYYTLTGRGKVLEEIEHIFQENTTNHISNEVLNKIKRKTKVNRSEFDSVPEYLISFNNGILDIRTWTFIPHSPKYYFLSKIKTNYNPKGVCPNIEKFLKKQISDKQDLLGFQEWLGYNLYRSSKYKKASILIGPPNSGKTVVMNLIYNLIGPENISNASFQKLCDPMKNHATAVLYGKLANICDDLDTERIKNVGLFKILTGGGVLEGEKKFQDEFVFCNYAKLTFACNKIPFPSGKEDEAYFIRWLIFKFDACPEDDINRDLLDELLKEMEGFLNYALEGLKRLLTNNVFSNDIGWKDIRNLMMTSGSLINAFVEDTLEEKEEAIISKEDLYDHYRIFYARRRKVDKYLKEPLQSIKKFGRDFPIYCPYVSERNLFNKKIKKQQRFWKNVSLKIEEF